MKPYQQTIDETRGVIPKQRPVKDSREDWIDRVCIAFEKFKKQKFYYDFSNELYYFLESEGLINFTTERKKVIAREYVEGRIESLTASLKSTSNEADKKAMQRQIDNLISGKENIRGKLRIEALQIFFKDCLELEKDLRTELELPEVDPRK